MSNNRQKRVLKPLNDAIIICTYSDKKNAGYNSYKCI